MAARILAPERARLEVALFPPKRSDQRATVFDIGMLAVGSGSDRHWLVDYFSPGPVGSAPSPGTLRPSNLPDLGTRSTGSGSRLSSTWLILPFGVLGLALLVPLCFGIVHWYRGYGPARLRRRHRPQLGAEPRSRALGRRGRARASRRAGARAGGA